MKDKYTPGNGHAFPKEFGFSGSRDDRVAVKNPYMRGGKLIAPHSRSLPSRKDMANPQVKKGC
jgi:hypothetical protein